MRHVSRSHRVALDWSFDRINLDPKIQIKYVDTKNQLADSLTKGNFTRDEWNHLLCLFNIGHFSSIMSKQDYQHAQHEHLTQYQLTPKSKWKMLRSIEGDFIDRHPVEHQFQLSVPKEEKFQFQCIQMCCDKAVLTIFGKLMWIEICRTYGLDSRRSQY